MTFANCFLDELGKRKTDFQDECDGDKEGDWECMMSSDGAWLRLRCGSVIFDRLGGQRENSSPHKEERKMKR